MTGATDLGPCPVCREPRASVIARLGGQLLGRCPGCRHGYLEVTAPASLESLYNDHYTGFRSDPFFQREARRVLESEVRGRVAPPARLLDVGCGNGEFLAVAQASGYRVTGIDVAGAAIEMGRRRGLADLRIGDLRASSSFDSDERFDLITFWDVIEHLPAPASFLGRARELLAPGGHVLVKTPLTTDASLRLVARIPRLAGPLLQVPSHIQYFKQDGLARLLRDAGFVDERWLSVRTMRAPVTGGRLRRRIARQIVRGLHMLMRDGNLLVLARRD